MYLSSLFLSELINGAAAAIKKCNEEFLLRFEAIQDHVPSPGQVSAGKGSNTDDSWNELMALWDVCRDFEEEICADLPVVHTMNAIRAIRGSGC